MAMNGIIIIDKPEDWTSHDVIGKLRGVLHERRIGHGGTLDPMATGVLPVFVGRATRAVEFCENAEKEYIAGMRLGITTDTQDTTGNILEESDASDISEEQICAILPRFIGNIEQIPPMYSAVKIGGKKLYELARKGVEVERKARRITIKEIEPLGGTADEFLIRVVCSKGTYIRTLIHDIGAAIGCGAAMCSLRRTRAGAFTLEDAVTLEDVQDAAAFGEAEGMLSPVDTLFPDYPEFLLPKRYEKICLNGGAFPAKLDNGEYRVYSERGEFLMLGKCENGHMHTIKSFFEVK